MECLAAFFFLFIPVFVALCVAVLNRIRNRSGRRRMFRHLARQFSGACDSGGIFSPPVVRLRYGETWAVVTEGRAFGPFPGVGFQIRVAWPHARVRCEIVSGLKNNQFRDIRHAWPEVPIGTDELSANFVVRSPDELEVRQFLTSGVIWQLDRLRHLGDSDRMYVLIRDGQIVVQKHWKRPRGDQPLQFVQGVFELYDQCMIAKAAGIEFLRTDEAQMLDHVVCMVCGEEITSDLVFCRRCKTPHHEECWQYAGSCAVFGCRETVFLSPQPGAPPAGPHYDDRPVKKPR